MKIENENNPNRRYSPEATRNVFEVLFVPETLALVPLVNKVNSVFFRLQATVVTYLVVRRVKILLGRFYVPGTVPG